MKFTFVLFVIDINTYLWRSCNSTDIFLYHDPEGLTNGCNGMRTEIDIIFMSFSPFSFHYRYMDLKEIEILQRRCLILIRIIKYIC